MGENNSRYIEYPAKGYLEYLTYDELLFVLKEFLRRGECSFLDFKRAQIQPKDLAKTIGSMANSDSGLIVLGVNQKNSKEPWEGIIDIDEWINNLSHIEEDYFLRSLDFKWTSLTLPNVKNPILLIFVPLCEKPILTSGRYYYRVDSSNRYAQDEETKILIQEEKKIKELGFSLFKKLKNYMILCEEEQIDFEKHGFLSEELKKKLIEEF